MTPHLPAPTPPPEPRGKTWRTGLHGLAGLPGLPLGTALLAAAAGLASEAGTLGDPTRPPAAVVNAQAAASAQAPNPAATPVARPAPPASAAARVPPQLQAVLAPNQGAAAALIDGQWLRPGDRLGDQVLQTIEPDAVLLRGAGGATERLTLLGNASKQLAGSIVRSRVASYSPPPGAASAPSGTGAATALAAGVVADPGGAALNTLLRSRP